MSESLVGKLAKLLFSQVTEPVKIEVCRGSIFGCPKGVVEPKDLEMDILDLMDNLGLEEELKEYLPEENVFQPTLRISISGCVNGCSRPHIKDIGLEGIVTLKRDLKKCTNCRTCLEACQEQAISIGNSGISFNPERCLSCGECARVCPAGALTIERSGVNLLVGGKLGRRPKIGCSVANFLTKEEAIQKLRQIFTIVLNEHRQGHNVQEVLNKLDSQKVTRSTGS